MIVKKLISSLIAVSVIAGSITIVSASDLKPNQTNEAANAIPSIVSAEFNEQGVNDFVTRLYDICIGRKPDANGLADWTGKLKNGKATGVSVAFGFIFSSEFQGKGYSNDEYVEIMYKAFFGRKSDPGGKADWLSKMNNGMSREDLFFGFANSKEFFNLCGSYGITAGCYIKGKDYNKVAQINLFVNRLYSIVLGRSCDQGGMQDWSNKLASGKISGIEAARGFFFSPEYNSKSKTYGAYIEDLYMALMGRKYDDNGKSYWMNRFFSGSSKENVFNGFAVSNEFSSICSSYGIVRGDAISEKTNTTDTLVREYPDVPKDNDTPLIVYGWNSEFPDLLDKYWGGSYEKVLTDSNSYQAKLDQVLASGYNAPDIFVCDVDYATKYMNSSDTIPVSDLGIYDSELSDMYKYTVDLARADNGKVKGLAWQACPCVVFYNRTVARQTLGVSAPSDVQPYFASWSAFLSTARKVNTSSNGSVKVVAGTDEVWRSYLGSRESGWVKNGKPNIDPIMGDYFSLVKNIYTENLTWEASQWGDIWTSSMSDRSVLSYWGPMWLLNYCMGFQDGSNPTTGDWGAVNAPGAFYWGGTWMMASKYCDNKATCGQIMRAISLNKNNLMDMARTGEFVNSISINSSLSNDSRYSSAYLGGQNPIGVLHKCVLNVDVTTETPYDQAINDLFNAYVTLYLLGEYSSVSAVQKAFTDDVQYYVLY